MWPHGDLSTLFSVMYSTFKLKKTRSLHINLNPSTFPYRQTVLNQFAKLGYSNLPPKNYLDYLTELSQYRFCLCVRGAGLDLHRAYEAWYLNSIPVIINNTETKMDNFIKHLKQLNLPFYEIKGYNFDKYTPEFFNESLYNSLKNNSFNLPPLKLSYYQ